MSTMPGSWSSLLTYQMRRDGFVHISAEREGNLSARSAPCRIQKIPRAAGLIWTKSLRWLGGELHLNAEANASSTDGDVRVVVLAVDGRERPGYGAADAVAFRGNSTDSVPRFFLFVQDCRFVRKRRHHDVGCR